MKLRIRYRSTQAQACGTKPRVKLSHTLFILCLPMISLPLLQGCTPNNKPTQSLEAASVGIHAGSLSESGDFAIVGSLYHGISYWHLGDKERLYNWNHQEGETTTMTTSDISADGQWALTAASHAMVLWDTKTGEGTRFWNAPATILDLALSEHGQFAMLGLDNHTAVLFNITKGGILKEFNHTNRVRSVAISAANKLALSGSEDGSAKVWSLTTGQSLQTIKHGEAVQLVELSKDASLALSASKYDKALIWSTHSGEILCEIPLRTEYLKRGLLFSTARFSKDNSLLVTGRSDHLVQLWQIAKPKAVLKQQWQLPKRSPWKPSGASSIDIAFKDENTLIAIASNGLIHTLEIKP